MSKFKVFFLICLIFLGCSRPVSKQGTWKENNGRLKVLSTVSMINDLVKRIGGERVDTCTLIHEALDPHSYELVKGDDEKLAFADLIFYNGLGLEHGVSLRRYLENDSKAIALGDFLFKNFSDQLLYVDGTLDPHIWMDLSLWIHLIDPIVETLSKKRPEFSGEFKKRGEELKQQIVFLDAEAYKLLQSIPTEGRYLVTTHDAFRYFTKRYLADPGEKNWQVRCTAPEGVAPEAQLSLNDIVKIVDHIEKYQIRTLFPESNLNQEALKKIIHAAKQRGCRIELSPRCLYGDTLGESSSYLDMMRYNIEVIHEGLRK